MLKQVVPIATLALVAFVCHAAAEDPRGPWIEVMEQGRIARAPVYEDVVHTEQKRALDVKHFRDIKAKVFDVATLVILKRKSYIKVASEAWGFVSLFNKLVKNSRELRKNGDPSPRVKSHYGDEMSQLVTKVTSTKSKNGLLSDQETYDRLVAVMNSIDKIIEASQAGLYVDWNAFTYDGESMPDTMAPVLDWLRKNGYKLMLKIVNSIGSLFKTIGKGD